MENFSMSVRSEALSIRYFLTSVPRKLFTKDIHHCRETTKSYDVVLIRKASEIQTFTHLKNTRECISYENITKTKQFTSQSE